MRLPREYAVNLSGATQAIKAIPTRYNGYRFRSRLEARWAVFFDRMDIQYEYEPEGFILDDGSCYLPDFWLPQYQYWIEVKGTVPTGQDYNKILAFAVDWARAGGWIDACYVALGEVGRNMMFPVYALPGHTNEDWRVSLVGDMPNQWMQCDTCGRVELEWNRRLPESGVPPGDDPDPCRSRNNCGGILRDSQQIKAALMAARAYRG